MHQKSGFWLVSKARFSKEFSVDDCRSRAIYQHPVRNSSLVTLSVNFGDSGLRFIDISGQALSPLIPLSAPHHVKMFLSNRDIASPGALDFFP